MASEVLIRESIGVNNFGLIKSKKDDNSSFHEFIGKATKEPEPKTESNVKKNETEKVSVAREKNPIKNSKEERNRDPQDAVVKKPSEVVSEEVAIEEVEYNLDEVVVTPVVVSVAPEEVLLEGFDSLIPEEMNVQVDDVSRDLQMSQENTKRPERISFDIDSVATEINKADLLKAEEINAETLPLITVTQQNVIDSSSFLSEEQIISSQMGKEVANASKSSELDSEVIVPVVELEKQADLLSKSLGFESKESILPSQAGVIMLDNSKQAGKISKNNLSDNVPSDLELTDIDGLPADAKLKQAEARNMPIARKEVVKIADNRVAEPKESIDNELLFDQEQLSFDKISDFAIIDNSKAKPEISFDEGLIAANKTSIKPQEQLSVSLKYAVSQGKSEITINLYPKALGAIDIKIEFATNSSGQSEVQKVIITSERNSTLKLLESTKSHLETALAELRKDSASTVTDTSKKEASLQFDMRGGNNGQPNEGYFGSFDERENWMNKFKNLTTLDNANAIKTQESGSAPTRKNIHNSTTIDIEV